MTDPNRYPPGWNAERVRDTIAHYDRQADDEVVAEDEAAAETAMGVPRELVPEVRDLIARRRLAAG
jgi:hypothetical protein